MDFNNKYETLDDFISSRLNDEEVGIWFYDNGLEKFIIKLPNHIIRAINQGCKLEMLVGQYFVSEKTYPVIGLFIYDHIDNPLIVTQSSNFLLEIDALKLILKRGNSILVDFYDELGVPVLSSNPTLSENTVEIQWQNIDTEYNNDNWKKVLDQMKLDFDAKNYQDFQRIEINVSNGVAIQSAFITDQNITTHHLEEKEGDQLEKKVFVPLESIFKTNNIFLNPYFNSSGRKKEFTDIFAHYELGTFYIESKVLSSQKAFDKSISKQQDNIKKQILKAVNQLAGALRSVSNEISVFDSKSNLKIEINKGLVPQCIILVSELPSFGEWEDLNISIFELISQYNCYLNIMELSDFMKIIKLARGSIEKLDYYLMKRAEGFETTKTFFYKTEVVFN